jgi:hypothetical protein
MAGQMAFVLTILSETRTAGFQFDWFENVIHTSYETISFQSFAPQKYRTLTETHIDPVRTSSK